MPLEAAFLLIGRSTVRFELTNATGARGVGTYRLALNLEWSPTSFDEPEGATILLGGELWELQASFAQDATLPLAQLQTIYAMAFPPRAHGTSTRIDLEVNLSAVQVEALEHDRDGGPIKLHLNLQGGVFRGASDETTPLSLVFSDNLVYRFRPSHWLEILEHWHNSVNRWTSPKRFVLGPTEL